jgi:hypothetical protein
MLSSHFTLEALIPLHYDCEVSYLILEDLSADVLCSSRGCLTDLRESFHVIVSEFRLNNLFIGLKFLGFSDWAEVWSIYIHLMDA